MYEMYLSYMSSECFNYIRNVQCLRAIKVEYGPITIQ